MKFVDSSRTPQTGPKNASAGQHRKPGTRYAVLAAISLVLIAASREDLNARRKLIEAKSLDQKAVLANQWVLFASLTPERQKQLCNLHARLEAESDRDALREVMRRYHDWLGTLVSYARNDLKRLPVDQRVEKIKQKCYWAQDERALRKWGESYIKQNGLSRAKLLNQIREQGHTREWMGRLSGSPNDVSSFLVKCFQLETADLTTLRSQLSEPGRERFDHWSPDERRKHVVRELAKMVLPRSLMGYRGETPRRASDEQLAAFFMSNSLSDNEREWLLGLPGKDMYNNLRRQYHWKNSPKHPIRQPGHGRSNWQSSSRRLGDSPDKPGRRKPADQPKHNDPRGREPMDPDGPLWLGPGRPKSPPQRPQATRPKDTSPDRALRGEDPH
ncbi:MAG: hypothetical protein JW888_03755 [Pirellulales bacterium]|nr:hypothetical protein [Pirellulales bacterium]